MSCRPADVDALIRDAMHTVPGSGADRRREGTRTLASAREFRKIAQLCRDDGLRLPVISNLHEAARLAISAVAAARGLRFANRPGAHVAVVDDAFGVQLVNRTEWAQLDELRDLRHKTNYPSDLIEPTDAELDQFSELTDAVIARAQSAIAPIPPPTASVGVVGAAGPSSCLEQRGTGRNGADLGALVTNSETVAEQARCASRCADAPSRRAVGAGRFDLDRRLLDPAASAARTGGSSPSTGARLRW